MTRLQGRSRKREEVKQGRLFFLDTWLQRKERTRQKSQDTKCRESLVLFSKVETLTYFFYVKRLEPEMKELKIYERE